MEDIRKASYRIMYTADTTDSTCEDVQIGTIEISIDVPTGLDELRRLLIKSFGLAIGEATDRGLQRTTLHVVEDLPDD